MEVLVQPPKKSYILWYPTTLICFCLIVGLSSHHHHSFILSASSIQDQIMTTLLTSYLSSAQKNGFALRDRDRGTAGERKKRAEVKQTDERRETTKWEIWRVELEEMKSDLLVHRVPWPLCRLGNGLVLLIVCVPTHRRYASWPVSLCVRPSNQDHANQCCLGFAVWDIHLDLALIISVVIFTKWIGFAVWYVSHHCFFLWLMRFQSTVSGQQNALQEIILRGLSGA